MNNFFKTVQEKKWAKISMYWIIFQFIVQIWYANTLFSGSAYVWSDPNLVKAYKMGQTNWFLFRWFLFGLLPIITGWAMYYINEKTGIFYKKKK
jgi:hypothetical protein